VLEPKNISEIYDTMMALKILNIKDSKNVKSLEDFIKSNKVKNKNKKN